MVDNIAILVKLLQFDDTLVRIIRDHIQRQTTVAQQCLALRGLIEIVCLLCQVGNYYGLAVVVGAMQSVNAYFMTEAWTALNGRYPAYVR